MTDDAVRRAFRALPPTHQAVLRLAREGHSYAAIADRLHVAPAQVRTWALHGVLALTSARLAPLTSS